LAVRLRSMGVENDELTSIQREVGTDADAAFQFARESPMPDPATATTDVFAASDPTA
jgi:TPP-dependent pyruvate/acetoin dehydrogenase alpha subunit